MAVPSVFTVHSTTHSLVLDPLAQVLAFIEPPLSSICVASGGLGSGGSRSDEEQARDRVLDECRWAFR